VIGEHTDYNGGFVLPVALPQNLLLARTDDVAVALIGLQVYTTGMAFELTVRAVDAHRRR